MTPQSPAIVVAMFDEPSAAEKAIDALREAGFDREQLGILARRHKATAPQAGGEGGSDPVPTNVAVAGVLATGLAAGAVGSASVMPGSGPILASGALGAALFVAGALNGGVRSALTGTGLSEEEAAYYENEYDSDRTIVVVKSAIDRAADAARILKEHGGVGRVKKQET